MNADQFFDLDFLASEPEKKFEHIQKPYEVVIIDDDDEVHKISKIALRNLKFDGRRINMTSLYSYKEARDFLSYHDHIAVILLDVVMEENDSGLKLVNFIRNTIKNDKVRIILRTGHPGLAPEASIMTDYDINDYRAKTELTTLNLNTSVIACLRNYRDIMKIDSYRTGLEKVINSTSLLFNYESLGLSQFLNGILEQLSTLIESENALVLVNRHFENGRLIIHDTLYKVIAATGSYKQYINSDYETLKSVGILPALEEIDPLDGHQLVYQDSQYYFGYHHPTFKSHTESYIYIINGEISSENEGYIKLFLKNLSLALDNFLLEQDSDEALKEVLNRLSSIVEARDGETGDHVYRVADMCEHIAESLGCSSDEIRNFKIASMLHDVGKIAVPDSILLKPGFLTKDEFSVIKQHTTVGGKLFSNSRLQLLQMAEEIAKYHHEHWDGSGYPLNLSGNDIPIWARIVTVADIFDALTHDRIYKMAWPLNAAKQYIADHRGHIFDPKIVDIFFTNYDEILKIMDRYQDG
jgi:response regulator RpfG family c-di-GMP phosphodiesterase